MKIRPRPVEELDDRCVYVPSFVGLRGAHADSRPWWVRAATWTTPAMLANELGPGGDGGEDLADTLGGEREGTQRHVAMLGRQHHALDSGDLGGGELTWVGARAGGAIVEGTGGRCVAAGMKTSRFEAEYPEGERERQAGLRAPNGAEEVRLGCLAPARTTCSRKR